MNDLRKPKVRLSSEMSHTTSQAVLKEFHKQKYRIYAFQKEVEERFLHIDEILTSDPFEPHRAVLYLNGKNWSQRVQNMNKYKDKFQYIVIPGFDWFEKHV